MSKKQNNTILGVDIGGGGIKMVELIKKGKEYRLLSYGVSEEINSENNDYRDDVKYIASVLNRVYKESQAKTTNVVAALPAYTVFSSVINMPKVRKEDVEKAVQEEARKVMPLSVEEMALHWEPMPENNEKNSQILLTGAPKKLVKKYLDIFKESNLNLVSLETESFSLIRSLLGNDSATVLIVEIGAMTTDIFVAKHGVPVISRSIDVGGVGFTKLLDKYLQIGFAGAEQFKNDLSFSDYDEKNEFLNKYLVEVTASIVNEIKHIINLYEGRGGAPIEKIILSGGAGVLYGFDKYLAKTFNRNVIIGDPFFNISYPSDLTPIIKEIGPRLSIACGLAIRGIN